MGKSSSTAVRIGLKDAVWLFGIAFMTEDEQSDDPAAIQRWIDELRALPPMPLDPSQEVERLAWQEKMKTFNLQAVRDQMKGGAR